MGYAPEGGCISNICMKLSFQRPAMSIREGSRPLLRPLMLPSLAAAATRLLRLRCGGNRVAPTIFQGSRRGASHGFHDVRQAEGMAVPGAVVHDQACPPRGAGLQAAGCRGRALEGDPD